MSEAAYEQEGNALLAVIDAMQKRGCRGCCTTEYKRDRTAVRDAVRRGDREALIRLAATYGLHHPVNVAQRGSADA